MDREGTCGKAIVVVLIIIPGSCVIILSVQTEKKRDALTFCTGLPRDLPVSEVCRG